MVILPLVPDQTIAQMWSNGARGGYTTAQQRRVTTNEFRSNNKRQKQSNRVGTVGDVAAASRGRRPPQDAIRLSAS